MWLVPSSIEPSHKFIERQALNSSHVLELLSTCPRIVISGLPGVGKTEIASQIIWRAKNSPDYAAIIWFNVASLSSFYSSLQDVARELGLIDKTESEATKIEDVRDMVRQELNRIDNWLVVFDNLDDITVITNFLPEPKKTRHMLITTRHRAMASALKAESIEASPLDPIEAVSLLTKSVPQLQSHSQSELLELVNALGCLPLAILQAGAYLFETQSDISGYFNFYKSSRKDLWDWRPFGDSSYVTVATVMAISFGKVKQSEVSVRLFCLLSFLDNSSVPETLWSHSEKFQDPILRVAFTDPVKTISALQPLLSYNFVRRSDGMLSMHRLVQDVMRDIIQNELQDQANVLELLHGLDRMPQYWVQRAIELISVAYPPSNPETWDECKKYNSNADCCILYGKKYSLESELFGDLQKAVGRYIYDQGGYNQANELFESALQMYKNACPENEAKIAGALWEVGRSLAQFGDHELALQRYQEALERNNAGYMQDLMARISLVTDMAKSLHGLGRYGEALGKLQAVLESTREISGTKVELESARIMAIMGAVLLSRKQLNAALEKCERSLAIQQRILGREHITLAGVICLLGAILHRKGRYRKALDKFGDALRIYNDGFGNDHIKASSTLDAIGLSYMHLGKCRQALQYFERELNITETIFGRDHIRTENAVFNLGASHLFLGKPYEALHYYERAMEIYGTKLCECHEGEGTQIIERHTDESQNVCNARTIP